jgi:hypothetical protein
VNKRFKHASTGMGSIGDFWIPNRSQNKKGKPRGVACHARVEHARPLQDFSSVKEWFFSGGLSKIV